MGTDILEKLCNASGPSGAEVEISEVITDFANKNGFIPIKDNMGNIIIQKSAKNPDLPTIMLDAHMDEIGMIVSFIDEDGFLKFETLGGINPQTLLNQKVEIVGKDDYIYKGVIGSKPPHKMEAAERDRVIKTKDMFIDIGASNKEEAEKKTPIGSYITFCSKFDKLENDIVISRNLDDRIGVAVMLEAMKNTKYDGPIYGVASVQEEVGLVGARPATYKINPDIAIALDVTVAGDHPGIQLSEAPVKCGDGPVIVLKDGGFIPDAGLVEELERVAKTFDIKYQKEVSGGGTTNGAVIQFQREGIPTATISVATRYIHSPVSAASMKDIQAMMKLITGYLDNLV